MVSIVNNTGSRQGLALVAISGALWGTIGIAAQAIYQQSDVGPLVVGFYRLALGFPCVALGCWFVLGRESLRVRQRDSLRMILIGVMLAFYQVCYFSAIEFAGVAVATLITLCTAPVIVSLASVLVLGETVTRHTLGALTLAVFGTGLLVGTPGEVTGLSDLAIGAGLSFASATGYAIVALLGRSLAGSCHPMYVTAVSFGVGALVLLPLVLVSSKSGTNSAEVWTLLVYLGLVPTALGYLLFFRGVRFIRASTAAILTMIEPLVATVLAWLLFAERLGPVAILGAALLLIGILVLYNGEKKSGPEESSG